jgi:hypothetical protein
MPRPELGAVMQRNWSSVELEGGAIPQWLEGLPPMLVHSVYASGGLIPGPSCSGSDDALANLMASIEVYRYSADEPVGPNRDWHSIITFASSDSMLLVQGPMSDSDHWLDKMPEWLRGAEVLEGSTKTYRCS